MTSDSTNAPAESDAVSAFTFVSEDFGTESHPDTAEVDESARPDQTLVVADPDDPGHMRTFVGDTEAPAPSDENSDRTMVLDSPDDALKTIQAVWGDEQDGATNPQMTLKAKEPRRTVKDSPSSLVIKTRALVESKDFRQSDSPEYELLNVLGEGGMGVVYDARQTSIDRNVALKMIKGTLLPARSRKRSSSPKWW